MTSIFIFRRDFRLNDNIGLIECCQSSNKVYPIFIFTPEQIDKNDYKSSNSVQFMIESLQDLDKNLKKYNSKLHLFYGDYLKVINHLINKLEIDNIFTNTDYTPYAIKRDNDIEALAKKQDINFFKYHDNCLFEPGTILTGSNSYYQKFTPFYNQCLKNKFPSTKKLRKKHKTILSKSNEKIFSISFVETGKFFTLNTKLHIQGGRKKAKKILKKNKTIQKL